MQVEVKAVTRTEDIFPEVVALIRLGDSSFQPFGRQCVFSPQEDERNVSLDRERAYDRAFDELMNIRSMSSRSLKVPGSISSPFTTR